MLGGWATGPLVLQEKILQQILKSHSLNDEQSKNRRRIFMEEETKFCKFCGAKIPMDAVMCKSCGRQVEKLKSSAPA